MLVYNTTTGEVEMEYNVKKYLHEVYNVTINFDAIIRLELKFSLKTVHLKTLAKRDKPDCYRFNISVSSFPTCQMSKLGLFLSDSCM